MIAYGHNGGPPLIDNPDEIRMRFARVHVSDLLHGIRTLTMEERGFYMTAFFSMYDRMGGLPLDDDHHCATIIGCDVRVYRRLKDRMIALGKLEHSRDGERLINKRVEDEITAYCKEVNNRRQAALERENRKRQELVADENRPTSDELRANFGWTSDELPPEVQETSGELPPKITQHLSEKTNKNNETTTTAAPPPSGNLWSYARASLKHKHKREEKNKTPVVPKGDDDAVLIAFEEFWKVFPGDPPPRGRKTDKPKAFETFRQIVTNTHRKRLKATAETILSGAKRYAATNPDPEFIPMPRTWLNGGRWGDVAQSVEPPDAPKRPPPFWWRGKEDVARRMADDKWRAAVKNFANGIWPEEVLGPAPGTDGCLVPQSIVTELALVEKYGPNGIGGH
jgi:uncharacterized protein YdaU (DUF1376 family)